MNGDLVNGLFEGIGACLLLLNIRQLNRDKEVKGFHAGPLAFFTTWGLWNCWFYPANGLWLSFVGGAVLASVNLAYVLQVVHYRYVRPWLEYLNFIDSIGARRRGTDKR